MLQSMGSQRVGHDWVTEQHHHPTPNVPEGMQISQERTRFLALGQDWAIKNDCLQRKGARCSPQDTGLWWDPWPNQQFSKRLRATGGRGHLSQHLCLAAEQGSRKQQIYFLENGTSSLDSLLLFSPSKLSKINVAKNKMPYRLLILTLTTAHNSEELAWNE